MDEAAFRTGATALRATTLRTMTWNLWWRFGPWQDRRTAILRTLEDVRPDVLGLQEVWGSADENMAGWLAEKLGMEWVWSRSPVQDRWHRRNGGDTSVDVGVAVLSRLPILASAERRLPAGDVPDDGKTALHALIDAPGGPLPFFTTHLNSAPADSAVRCAQVVELAAFVAEHTAVSATHPYRHPYPYPPVVTGDFNAEPDCDELRLIGGHKTAPAVPGLVLFDVWPYADPAAESGTWDIAHEDVHGFRDRQFRIDYIHVGLPVSGTGGRIRAVRRAGDRPVDGVWPSDHAAVVADLSLAGPPLGG